MLLEEIDVLIGWVCMKITYQRTKTTLILWKDSVSIGKKRIKPVQYSTRLLNN